MASITDHEARINSALGKVLRYFNFLELNLGLCIRFLENSNKPQESHLKLVRTSIQDKLKWLRNLLFENNLITDLKEFELWYQEANKVRCVRNFYVHGTWHFSPITNDHPLLFMLPPWRSEKIYGENELRMSISDLEKDADHIQSTFSQFMLLRKKYNF